MSLQNACTLPVRRIKEPKNLSERIAWLREYYLKGAGRAWNNTFILCSC